MKTKQQVHNKWIWTLFVGFLTHFTIVAQSAEIQGSVIDELGPLPGASILIKGTQNGAITDFDGNFNLVNVESGNLVLVVSYLGYQNKEVELSVAGGEVAQTGNIVLEPLSTALKEVVLQGNYLPSQQKALNMKKHSLAIMEVMASDAIGKLPDRNAAEAVQRMQGVSIERDHGEGRYVIVRGTPIAWNSTLLNGDRMPSTEGTSDNTGGTRAAPLDIFPSEMIQYVQLSKAITPDMEGDAIGGSVNFITKTAPSKKTMNVNLGYGYNDQAHKPTQNISLIYGDREADGKIGFLVSGTYWNRNWGTDNYEVAYDENDQSINELQLRDYLGTRTTYGLNVGLEYSPNENHKLYLRSLYTDFQDEETAVEHMFTFSESTMGVRVRHGITGINLYGGELGGNHSFSNGKFGMDWKFSTYTGEMESRDLPNSSAAGAPAYLMSMFEADVTYGGLAPDGKKYLDLDAPAGYNGDHFDNIQPYLTTGVAASDFGLSQLISFESRSLEQDYTGQLDISFTPSKTLKLKAGGKYKHMNLERGAPMNIAIYLGGDYGAPLPMTQFETRAFPANGGFLTELDEPYTNVLAETITLDRLDDLFSEESLDNPLFYTLNRNEEDPASAGSFYSGSEKVAAAYVMGELALSNHLQLIGGIRYEHTALNYTGNVVASTEEGDIISSIENKNDFASLLPMLHVKYSPLENLNLRAAYTRTFARANFSELNPTETRVTITSPPTIARGNINLEPTYSNNLDLMGEYFFENVGLLSGGVFYKALENVIYTARSFENIDGQRYQITQPQNSENGWLAGFELGLSKRLTFLPGFLGGLGVEANYTFTDSEMDVPEYSIDPSSGEILVSTTTEKIPNQSQHIFNSALFYEKGALTVRLAGNYKGESLAVVQGNPENYRWYDKNFTMDFSASYSFNRKLKFYLELNNLTNEPLRYYQGTTNRPEQTEYYALRGLVGINYRLF